MKKRYDMSIFNDHLGNLSKNLHLFNEKNDKNIDKDCIDCMFYFKVAVKIALTEMSARVSCVHSSNV